MTFSFNKIRKVPYAYFLIAFMVLIAIVIGKDVLHAVLLNYHFYLSESLLFSSFWLLFVPLISGQVIISPSSDLRSTFIIAISLSLLHLIAFALIVFLVSLLFFTHTFQFYNVFIHAVSENGLTVILLYLTVGFLLKGFNVNFPKIKEPIVTNRISIQYGGKTFLVSLTDIVSIQTEKPYIALHTINKRHLLTGTLKQFLDEYQEIGFMQVHKSTIVNIDKIVSFRSRHNGDYDIELSNGQSVRASRHYADQFKKYL